MDIFESARRAARDLHQALVASGIVADDLAALVNAAANRLEIDLIGLPGDEPTLKGARALYDSEFGHICYDKSAGAGERECLIAHELGHVVLHHTCPASHCKAEDIDLSQSTEAAPVGLQRVEDYGVRERRELQANVFAREFLLPRSIAREKHFSGYDDVGIAEALKLPLPMVRQQLLDALLLPEQPQPTSSTTSTLSESKDDGQESAVIHRERPFLLQAGPGTGKTKTLVKRVSSLIEDGVDPASILILTFSNRAAGELVERLANVSPEAAPKIWVGTFHAFGLDLIRRYSEKFGLPPSPRLFDRSDSIDFLQDRLPLLDLVHYRQLWDPANVLRDILNAISRAKDELLNPQEYLELAAATADSEVRAKTLEIGKVYEIYQDELRKRSAIDFGDLIMLPARLLKSDSRVRDALQLRHKHILVDEYQDVNRASVELLKGLSGDGRNLWVVGDSRQSIYRFRGASSSSLTSFMSEYPGAITKALGTNYRSSSEIVSLYQRFSKTMLASEGMLPLSLCSLRGASGHPPQLGIFTTDEDEAAGIAAAIRDLNASGVAYQDQVVLCRSNARLSTIAAELEGRGIPTLHLGSLFERSEIRDLLALLSLAADSTGDGLARLAAMDRYRIPLEDIRSFVWKLRLQSPKMGALSAINDISSHPDLSPAGQQGLAQLAQDLQKIPSETNPWEFLVSYLLGNRLLVSSAQYSGVQGVVRGIALWQFLNFVRNAGPTKGQPFRQLLSRIRQMVLLAEERDLRQVPASAAHLDAVRLMTVHASKGLEFDAVHVPSLCVGNFPANRQWIRCPAPAGLGDTDSTHLMEEQCLFFVAMSRARKHLRLYRPSQQYGGNTRSPSPMLKDLGMNALASAPRWPSPNSLRSFAPVSVAATSQRVFTDTELAQYQKCPRRFFYTHILGLSGRRRTTPFDLTHNCVYEVIEWLTKERSERVVELHEVTTMFDALWEKKGPLSHAFAVDYRNLAVGILTKLFESGRNLRFQLSTGLTLSFKEGNVLVQPTEIVKGAGGKRVLRKIRTGRSSKSEVDRFEYSLYLLAGRHIGANSTSVEAVCLGDDKTVPIDLSSKVLSNRQAKIEATLIGIGSGEFPPTPNVLVCPRCPHFFVCNSIAPGSISLEKKG